jgi:hypothetical protein
VEDGVAGHEVIIRRARLELGRFLSGLGECEEVCEMQWRPGVLSRLMRTQPGRVWLTLKNQMSLLGGQSVGTSLVQDMCLAQDIHLVQDMASGAGWSDENCSRLLEYDCQPRSSSFLKVMLLY